MRSAAMSGVVLALALGACGETLPEAGHVVVYLDSDVPLPKTGLTQGNEDVVPILDTARIEVLHADGSLACADCQRDIALETASLDALASFTIVAPGAEILHAIAFRSDTLDLSGGHAAVEVWGAIPPPPAEGAREITISFRFDDIGKPVGSLDAPARLDEGRPMRPRRLVRFAERIPCGKTPPPGTACVPGGMFWLGTTVDMPTPTLLPPRVVALHPFFVDLHEVSVGEYRTNGGLREGLTPNSGSLDGEYWDDYCSFTEEPGRLDDYPVNCVTWSTARAYCLARGGDLLTEAQMEYVATALRELPYPWGYDRPGCNDTVLARAPATPESRPTALNRDCLPDTSEPPDIGVMGFPKEVSRAELGRDFVELEGGRVQDLAGNLTEWVLDDFDWRDGICWESPTSRIDPICVDPKSGRYPARGGSFAMPLAGIAASWRQDYADDPGIPTSGIGIRCAYPTSD